MRRALLIAYSVVLLGVLAAQVYEKERILAGGERVFLELAPVDPRSLMQGDYMRLGFTVSRTASAAVGSRAPRSGRLVVRVDERGVGHFVRLDDGSPLAPDERLLRFRARGTRLRVVPDSFLFQEGHGAIYQGARYGVLVFDGPNKGLLAGLADENRELIRP